MMPNIFVFQNPQDCLLKIKLFVIFLLIIEIQLTLVLLYYISPKRSRHSEFCKVNVIAMQVHNADTVMKNIQN